MTTDNDKFGFNRYVIIVMAPMNIERQAARIRTAVGQNDFGVTNPAHVTVVPPFFGIDSLDMIKQIVGEIAGYVAPISIDFNQHVFVAHPEFGTAGIVLREHPELIAVQKEIEKALLPHIGGSQYPEEYRYVKHMNYVWKLPEDRLKLAVELGEKVDLGEGFTAETIVLSGYMNGGPVQSPLLIEEFALDSALN